MRPPIRFSQDDPREMLDPASRLHLARLYTVEHNIKAMPFGRVHQDSENELKTQFNIVWARRAGGFWSLAVVQTQEEANMRAQEQAAALAGAEADALAQMQKGLAEAAQARGLTPAQIRAYQAQPIAYRDPVAADDFDNGDERREQDDYEDSEDVEDDEEEAIGTYGANDDDEKEGGSSEDNLGAREANKTVEEINPVGLEAARRSDARTGNEGFRAVWEDVECRDEKSQDEKPRDDRSPTVSVPSVSATTPEELRFVGIHLFGSYEDESSESDSGDARKIAAIHLMQDASGQPSISQSVSEQSSLRTQHLQCLLKGKTGVVGSALTNNISLLIPLIKREMWLLATATRLVTTHQSFLRLPTQCLQSLRRQR